MLDEFLSSRLCKQYTSLLPVKKGLKSVYTSNPSTALLKRYDWVVIPAPRSQSDVGNYRLCEFLRVDCSRLPKSAGLQARLRCLVLTYYEELFPHVTPVGVIQEECDDSSEALSSECSEDSLIDEIREIVSNLEPFREYMGYPLCFLVLSIILCQFMFGRSSRKDAEIDTPAN